VPVESGRVCVVRVPRRVFQILLGEAPTPERCLEAYHLHRTRLELIAEQSEVSLGWTTWLRDFTLDSPAAEDAKVKCIEVG
jgi:hypothetical protein